MSALKFSYVTHTAPDGARVEVGTVEHEGREFKALGSMVGDRLMVGYLIRGEHVLRTGEGVKICDLQVTGSARGFHGVKLVCYAGVYQGHRWHGRGLGENSILVLRRGRAVSA